MTSDRIKEIQDETAYPESVSVMLALKRVWHETAQSLNDEIKELKQSNTWVLWDNINHREARLQWFLDVDNNCWIDVDPRGVQMSGNVTIKFLPKNHKQYTLLPTPPNQ